MGQNHETQTIDAPNFTPAAGPCPSLPLVEELSPSLTPWEVCRRLAHHPYLIFLDSAFDHPSLGRYSFVAADPFATLRARGRSIHINWGPAVGLPERQGDPFAELAETLAGYAEHRIEGLPPFQGGVAGL